MKLLIIGRPINSISSSIAASAGGLHAISDIKRLATNQTGSHNSNFTTTDIQSSSLLLSRRPPNQYCTQSAVHQFSTFFSRQRKVSFRHFVRTFVSTTSTQSTALASTNKSESRHSAGMDNKNAAATDTGEEDTNNMSLYERAVYQLNCLQSNAQLLANLQTDVRRQRAESNVDQTRRYLQLLGISLNDIDRLNVVHITGTKGKGSTAAFLEAILRRHGYKTGFYCSPHLVQARERIRINGKPIPEECFAKEFFHVFDTLKASMEPTMPMPAYFKFLTLLAFRIFCAEHVDVAIVEVGIGGEYDCTNVIQRPWACGITTLDLDHTKLLGHSIPEIAWHKAGIAKPGSTLFSVEQPPEAMEVIRQRCLERQCQFLVVPSTLTAYQWPTEQQVRLGIPGQQQHTNVSLALQLFRCWMDRMRRQQQQQQKGQEQEQGGEEPLPPAAVDAVESLKNAVGAVESLKRADGFPVAAEVAEALQKCRWPGRSQLLQRGSILYHLDGAHTPQSIQYCAQWFEQSSLQGEKKGTAADVLRILIFHCTGDRDSAQLLPKFKNCRFNRAFFCPARIDASPSPLSRDNTNLNIDPEADRRRCELDRAVWLRHCADVDPLVGNGDATAGEEQPRTISSHTDDHSAFAAAVFPSISDALAQVEQLAVNNPGAGGGVHVLVTGSLHLVGGVLALLDPTLASSC